MPRDTNEIRKRIAFDPETWLALGRLAKDRMKTIQDAVQHCCRCVGSLIGDGETKRNMVRRSRAA